MVGEHGLLFLPKLKRDEWSVNSVWYGIARPLSKAVLERFSFSKTFVITKEF